MAQLQLVFNPPDRTTSHVIWVPDFKENNGNGTPLEHLARRYMVYHEIGHLLMEDDARLRERHAECEPETDEENLQANRFALLCMIHRGPVAVDGRLPLQLGDWNQLQRHLNVMFPPGDYDGLF